MAYTKANAAKAENVLRSHFEMSNTHLPIINIFIGNSEAVFPAIFMYTYLKTSYYDSTSSNGTTACLKRRLSSLSKMVERYPDNLPMQDIPIDI